MQSSKAVHNHGLVIKNMTHKHHILCIDFIIKGKHQQIILPGEDINAAIKALLGKSSNIKKDQFCLQKLQQHITAHLAILAKADF